jgi:hypothetical protein
MVAFIRLLLFQVHLFFWECTDVADVVVVAVAVAAAVAAVASSGESSHAGLGYDWAVVTNGPPRHNSLNAMLLGEDRCRTGNALAQNQGRWGAAGKLLGSCCLCC